MVINIAKIKREYWVLTDKTAEPYGNLQAAAKRAAELVYKADEVKINYDYYSLFLDYLEEDEAEKPDWSFLPFGMMQFFTALADKKDVVKLANDEEKRETIRSLSIGKEQYR